MARWETPAQWAQGRLQEWLQGLPEEEVTELLRRVKLQRRAAGLAQQLVGLAHRLSDLRNCSLREQF